MPLSPLRSNAYRRRSWPLGQCRTTCLVFAALLAIGLSACDSGNPVVPVDPRAPDPGTEFTVTLAIEPSELIAGSGQPGTVSVTVVRSSDNMPATDGTLVEVNTDLGNFGTGGEGEITTQSLVLEGGVATTNLFPTEEQGTATVLAEVGQSTDQLTVPFVASTTGSFFITRVEPNSGTPDGGDVVAVVGGGFNEPLTVDFMGVQATVLSVNSGRIQVQTPPSTVAVTPGTPLPVDVTVTRNLDETPEATTLTGGFFYTLGGDSVFVTEVVPNSGGPEGGEIVTVFGGGFRDPVRVDFGTRAGQSPTLVSSSEIQVVVPAPATAVAAGDSLLVDVTVTSALDQPSSVSATLTGAYSYQGRQAITVSALSPSQGPYTGGTEVTLTGQGFESPVAVELAGIRQLGEVVVSGTEITFTTAGTGVEACPANGLLPQTEVIVTNLGTGDTGSANLTFNYQVPSPTIDRVAPGVGPQLGNTNLTVEGADFEAPVRVSLLVGMDEFVATVQSTATDSVTATTPMLPDSLFTEVDCTTADDRAGKRYIDLNTDVQVINLDSGCTDLVSNAYIVEPTDPSCRPTGDGGGA